MAAAVVKDLYPDRLIVIPDDATALVKLDEADLLPKLNCVIWLDHAERYLSGLKESLVLRLAEHHSIVATLSTAEWERLATAAKYRLPEGEILRFFKTVHLRHPRDQSSDEV